VVDTVVFSFIAFWGILPSSLLLEIIIANYFIKTGVEIIFTPITYKVVYWLKSEENEDYYDYKTDFNPFKLSDNNV
jgi:uncharacterized PurR-regulated membrane protein YhhQ (DUF165 family)